MEGTAIGGREAESGNIVSGVREDLRRPLVGLTVGNRRSGTRPPSVSVNRAYVTSLRQAGADVVLLAPGDAVPPAILHRLDGILLPGGLDVEPSQYGESPRPELGDVDGELDHLELSLVHVALERGLPLFGICRGQQVVNVALGGTLYQDLAADGATTLRHQRSLDDQRTTLSHAIDVVPGSHLHRRVGADRVDVNSFHHQAVRDLAPGLVVTATCPDDGLIEGLETRDGQVVAIQCHPEELTGDHTWARALFRAFVVAAGEFARRPVA